MHVPVGRRVFLGFLIFLITFVVSEAVYFSGRSGADILISNLIALCVMIGSGLMLAVSIVGLWEIVKARELSEHGEA